MLYVHMLYVTYVYMIHQQNNIYSIQMMITTEKINQEKGIVKVRGVESCEFPRVIREGLTEMTFESRLEGEEEMILVSTVVKKFQRGNSQYKDSETEVGLVFQRTEGGQYG